MALEFLRLKDRPILKSVCSPRFTPSDYLLTKVFSLPEDKVLTDRERIQYVREFRKNCVQLMNALYDRKYYEEVENAVRKADQWLESLLGGLDEEKQSLAESVFARYEDRLRKVFGYDTLEILLEKMIELYGREHFLKVIWKGTNKKFKLFAELFVNIGLKLYENTRMSWTQWITTTSEGMYLLELLERGDRLTRRYAGAVLVTYLLTIYITEGYDEQLFHKEMLSFLPVLSQYLPAVPLLPLGISQLTSRAILTLVKKSIQAELDIPDEWFQNWHRRR